MCHYFVKGLTDPSLQLWNQIGEELSKNVMNTIENILLHSANNFWKVDLMQSYLCLQARLDPGKRHLRIEVRCNAQLLSHHLQNVYGTTVQHISIPRSNGDIDLISNKPNVTQIKFCKIFTLGEKIRRMQALKRLERGLERDWHIEDC